MSQKTLRRLVAVEALLIVTLLLLFDLIGSPADWLRPPEPVLPTYQPVIHRSHGAPMEVTS